MVHFVGAGCGAPDLLTLRGKKYISEADRIIYAGSLVNPALLLFAKEDCIIHDSAVMTLEEVLAVMEQADAAGENIVRLHTGEPSLYGAIREQMDALAQKGIAYDVTPGVSAFAGAAASLKAEYTLPEVSQTLIITRMEGKTAVPEKERLHKLAAHGASMAIYLSAGLMEKVQDELMRGAYTADTPAAIVYKATWEDEKCIRTAVGTLAKAARENGISKTAVILVGDFLGNTYAKSRLYAADFTTGYRKAKKGDSGEANDISKNADRFSANTVVKQRSGASCITFTDEGEALARRLSVSYPCTVTRCPRDGSLADWTAAGFRERETLIFIGAAGIAARAVAPHIRHKAADPAVIVIDEGGQFVIPLLSGHLGGANAGAKRIAEAIGAEPVITTATDIRDAFAVDVWAKKNGLSIINPEGIKHISAAILRGEEIFLETRFPIAGEMPQGLRLMQRRPEEYPDTEDASPCALRRRQPRICITASRMEAERAKHSDAVMKKENSSDAGKELAGRSDSETEKANRSDIGMEPVGRHASLVLVPKIFAIGIGCRRGTPGERIREAVNDFLAQNDILPESVFTVASIDKKEEEPGILAFCRENGLPFITFSAEELNRQEGDFTHSDFVEMTVGVDNVCERAAVAACRTAEGMAKRDNGDGSAGDGTADAARWMNCDSENDTMRAKYCPANEVSGRQRWHPTGQSKSDITCSNRGEKDTVRLVLHKRVFDGITLALAQKEFYPVF